MRHTEISKWNSSPDTFPGEQDTNSLVERNIFKSSNNDIGILIFYHEAYKGLFDHIFK